MEKIKALMEQMGFSPELTDEFIKTINEHVEAKDKALKEAYEAKIEKAKEVCLQAVKEEKVRLARGVEVFLESKNEKIERSRAQQMAIEESESANQLKRVKALLEGVEISKVEDSDGQLQAANRKISLLEHKVGRFAKEANEMKDKLRASNNIAAKNIRKAMMLESRLKKTKETKKTSKAAISESKRSDDGKGGTVIQESLNNEKTRRAPAKTASKPSTKKEITIDTIADSM